MPARRRAVAKPDAATPAAFRAAATTATAAVAVSGAVAAPRPFGSAAPAAKELLLLPRIFPRGRKRLGTLHLPAARSSVGGPAGKDYQENVWCLVQEMGAGESKPTVLCLAHAR